MLLKTARIFVRPLKSWSEADQVMTVIRTADVQPVLDHAALNRNELGLNKNGIAESWWCYATILYPSKRAT